MATKGRAALRLTPGRWQQVKVLVADALEIEPAQRALFIERACQGDKALQDEVELLVGQDAAEIDHSADEAARAAHSELDSQPAGRRLGAYELVRELGRGGMGTVWLARRADQQFEKLVAVKLLKRGTDTDEVLRRFRAERQILAQLDHPNLARLLDAGTADDGLPYFVMEYVIGTPINQYIAEHELSVTRRLKLFQAVCSAVSYAHQNLVIHRDIKPSNVLVTASGEVRLLDFGIAKLVQETDTEEANVTVTMLRVMTPEYASPEQIKGEPVTTVSDVYSLGVFLYELLTGSRPYKLKRRTSDEITKAICEQEPERPSTAVTQTTNKTEGIDKVRKQLRGDLDNIVLKALRKEPRRRYTSVDQLAEDIRRHLEGLPVGARKDTAAYRASKFIQRHKLGVGTAVIAALALIGGTAVIISQAHKASVQGAIAEERFREVRELAHSVLFDYHDAIAALPGSTAVRERLVKDSLKYLDRLTQKAGNDLSLQEELAIAYIKVGDVQGRPATANLGDAKGALENYHKALLMSERMIALAPKNADILVVLATSYGRLGETNTLSGNPAAAVEQHRQSLAVFEQLNRTDPRDSFYQACLAFSHRMLAQALGVPTVANVGDTRGALEHLQKAAIIDEALPDQEPSADLKKHSALFIPISKAYRRENLSYVYGELATVFDALGKTQEALESLQKSASLTETMLAEDPRNTFIRRNLAVNCGNLANFLLKAGDRETALARNRQSLALYEALATEDPNNLNARKDLALGYRNMGKVLAEGKDTAGASSYYHKAVDVLEGLVAQDQDNAFLRRHLAYTYLRISMLMSDSDDLSGAVNEAHLAIAICESLVAADPKNSTARNTLALSYSQLGQSYSLLASKMVPLNQQKKLWQEAKNWYQKSLDLWQEMKKQGTLGSADAHKPGEVQSQLAKCEEALATTTR